MDQDRRGKGDTQTGRFTEEQDHFNRIRFCRSIITLHTQTHTGNHYIYLLTFSTPVTWSTSSIFTLFTPEPVCINIKTLLSRLEIGQIQLLHNKYSFFISYIAKFSVHSISCIYLVVHDQQLSLHYHSSPQWRLNEFYAFGEKESIGRIVILYQLWRGVWIG